MEALPDYDYHYFGDTLHVPYGNRSHEAVYALTKRAVDYLFQQNCQLIILACNTASADALRKLQQEYLPTYYPDRRILGVIIPTVEEVAERAAVQNLGVIATAATVGSMRYPTELSKLRPEITVIQQAAPLLVPLIENGGQQWLPSVLETYLQPLRNSAVDAIILGCTHYGLVKGQVQQLMGPDCLVVSQDDIVPEKLRTYLERHPEHEQKLGRRGARVFTVTDLSQHMATIAEQLFGAPVTFYKVAVD